MAAAREGAEALQAFRNCAWAVKNFYGRVQNKEERQKALLCLDDDRLIRALTEGDSVLLKAAERLFVTCAAALKRPEAQSFSANADTAKWFRRILAVELACNYRDFGASACPRTLAAGELRSVFQQILEEPEFEEWKNQHWAVKQAVAMYCDPRQKLRQAGATYHEILAESEFCSWAATPSLVLNVVILHSNPREKLRRADSVTEEILQEPEFEEWSELSGTVRLVALRHKDARQKLRDAGVVLAEILCEPEFESWTACTGQLRDLVLNCRNVRTKLRKAEIDTRKILEESAFQHWADSPGLLRGVVVRGGNSRAKVRAIDNTVADILNDSNFKWWTSNPGYVRHAVVNLSNPRRRLSEAQYKVEEVLRDPEFKHWSDSLSALRRIALRTGDLREKLRAVDIVEREILRESEFAHWAHISSVARLVIMRYTSPRAKLRQIDVVTEQILQEPEFRSWQHVPGRIREIVLAHGDPRKKLREIDRTTTAILRDPEFANWKESLVLVRNLAQSHSEPRALLKFVKENRIELIVNHFDFIRRTMPRQSYQALCELYSIQPPIQSTELPAPLYQVELAIAGSGGVYNALCCYHAQKKVEFPYTPAIFFGRADARRRRIVGNFNASDIRRMRAAGGNIDETIFGLARCTSADKGEIRALMVDQVAACFKDESFAYLGLENASMDSLRLLHEHSNVDLRASLIVEQDDRTLNAMRSVCAELDNGGVDSFRRLRIERGNINNRLATLAGSYGVVNLDYWGHFCRGTMTGLANLFARHLIASDGLVFVTVANRSIDQERSERAGFARDQGKTIEDTLQRMALESGYVIRAFTALSYRGGVNDSRGMEMLFCTAHVQRYQ